MRGLVRFYQQSINVEKMGQPIRGPMQTRFFNVLRYFLQVISEFKYVGLVRYDFVTLNRNYSHLIL